MLTRRIIPCLDVKDGRVVKGVKFQELRDAGDPVEAARAYGAAGADELCFLDISASLESRGTLVQLVERVALEMLRAVTAAVPVPVIASGGAGVAEHFADAFEAGAAAALAASVFHFGTLSISQVKQGCADRGFPMRWPA